jgi:hypothetical protein
MKIIKRELETHHVNFIGPIVDLLHVETINGKYYAYFETDESVGTTKVSIKLLGTDKEYKSEETEGYWYKQTIPSDFKSAADFFGSFFGGTIPTEPTEYHVYYKIDYDYTNEEDLKKKNKESKEAMDAFVEHMRNWEKGSTFTSTINEPLPLEKIDELIGESKPIITIKTTIKPRINIDKLNRLI